MVTYVTPSSGSPEASPNEKKHEVKLSRFNRDRENRSPLQVPRQNTLLEVSSLRSLAKSKSLANRVRYPHAKCMISPEHIQNPTLLETGTVRKENGLVEYWSGRLGYLPKVEYSSVRFFF